MSNKTTNYFSHDYDAHTDPRCSILLSTHGAQGYGVYWLLIETMYQQGGHIKIYPNLYTAFARLFNIEEEVLVELIEVTLPECGLIIHEKKDDGNYITSKRVLGNLQKRDERYQARAEAGRQGGIKSGVLRREKIQEDEVQLEVNEPKENKGKQRKKKQVSSLQIKEMTKVNADALRLADILLEYITINNPKFKSDKNTVPRWADDIDKMVRIDERNPVEIEQVIMYSQTDDFWQCNILSGKKLRAQYDQLWVKAKNGNQSTSVSI